MVQRRERLHLPERHKREHEILHPDIAKTSLRRWSLACISIFLVCASAPPNMFLRSGRPQSNLLGIETKTWNR
jgi:hypothetical protein